MYYCLKDIFMSATVVFAFTAYSRKNTYPASIIYNMEQITATFSKIIYQHETYNSYLFIIIYSLS